MEPREVEQPEKAHPICTTSQGPSSGLSTSLGVSGYTMYIPKNPSPGSPMGGGRTDSPPHRFTQRAPDSQGGLQSYLLRFGMTGPDQGTHPSPSFSEGTWSPKDIHI